jgi:hypothetical protein
MGRVEPPNRFLIRLHPHIDIHATWCLREKSAGEGINHHNSHTAYDMFNDRESSPIRRPCQVGKV